MSTKLICEHFSIFFLSYFRNRKCKVSGLSVTPKRKREKVKIKDESLLGEGIQYPRQKEDTNSGNEAPNGKSSLNRQSTTTEEDPLCKKRRRCGECIGCRADNCKVCPACLDMPKYGGPGNKRQVCR